MLLSEIDELRQAGAEQAIRSYVQGFFAGITALIAERRRKRKEECLRDFSSAESAFVGALGKDGSVIGPRIVGRSVAVLGVDLVISEKISIGSSGSGGSIISSSSSCCSSSSNNNSSSDSSGSSSDSSGNGLDAYIVEVNNNPAMPSPTKHSMSEQYRQHLVDLAAAIIGLGLSHCSTT